MSLKRSTGVGELPSFEPIISGKFKKPFGRILVWWFLRTFPRHLRRVLTTGDMPAGTTPEEARGDMAMSPGKREYVAGVAVRLIEEFIKKAIHDVERKNLRVRATGIIGLVSAILPPRIANEELGDAMEDIDRRISENRPRYEIRAKLWASVGWALFHSLLYVVRRTGKALKNFRPKGS